jgi:hypothetical protein
MRKLLSIAILALFFSAGCVTKTKQIPPLTSKQAKIVAVQLANDEARKSYKCQPFTNDRPIVFRDDKWLWTSQVGCGHYNVEAVVELAANGLTNRVRLQLFDNGPDEENLKGHSLF